MAGPLKQVRFATRNVFHSPPASPTIISGFRGGPGAGGDAYVSSGLTPLSLGSASAYSMMPSTPIKGSSLKSSSASHPTPSRTPTSVAVAAAPPVTPTHMHHMPTMLAGATPMKVAFQPMSVPAPLIPMMMTTMARPPPPPQSGPAVPPTPTYMPLPAAMQMPAFSPARPQSRHSASHTPPPPPRHPYAHPALHPLLDHQSNARSLKWDLRDSPSGAISGLAFGFGSEPATHPPVAKLVLRCVYLPGCIDILPGASTSRTLSTSSSSHSTYVTLLDVLYAIYASLRTNIREDEYASLRPDDRRRAYEAYTTRWHRVQSHSSKRSNQSSEGSGEKERKGGMKRVDLLLEHAAFTGLVPVPVEEGGSGSDWFLCVR